MKRCLLMLAASFLFSPSQSQVVSNIAADYHDGQIFLTWTNIATCDTGFYYVYKNSVPITDANIQSSAYLGRIPFNFGYDYRLSYSVATGILYYLITNDTPYTMLDTTQNLFVLNCTDEGAQDYFAVRCDINHTSANWHVATDSNATSNPVTEHLDPVKCYLVVPDLADNSFNEDETMDCYIHYGSNIAVGSYPAMVNEGCLPFHFGILKFGSPGGHNACYLKFHGGKGNFVNNAITAHMKGVWKISFDDWIPAFGFDSVGYNTRWFGYHENFNIYEYDKNSPPPVAGVIHAYTYQRIKWELEWIRNQFPDSLDANRQYLVGSSQGCAAVLINAMIDPLLYSSGGLSEPKYYVAAPDDMNPDCKYNDDGAARKETRVLWGNEEDTNLFTDVPTAPGSSDFFRIYDLTNMNYMLHNRRNTSLPFLSAVNGKEDANTCWCEKISVYDSIQSTHAGGIYFWDLREHGGGAGNSWPPLSIPGMQRFNNLISYPAFSYTSLDGYPGDDNVVDSPYYNGEDVGALHASIDWVDSSIVDSSYFWQIQLFTLRNLLNDGITYVPMVLPEIATTDVTIRRPQNFKNFPAGTKLCWLNFYHGELIQSGTVIQLMDDTDAVPITIPGVKVFPDGNILRVIRCDSLQPTGMLIPEEKFNDWNNGLVVSGDEFALNSMDDFHTEVIMPADKLKFILKGRKAAGQSQLLKKRKYSFG